MTSLAKVGLLEPSAKHLASETHPAVEDRNMTNYDLLPFENLLRVFLNPLSQQQRSQIAELAAKHACHPSLPTGYMQRPAG